MADTVRGMPPEQKQPPPLEPFSLPRSGDRPLSFDGIELGTGEIGGKFWTRVTIYRTASEKYVAYVVHGSHHADNQGHAVAHVVSSVPELLHALRDRAGKLGNASSAALAQAVYHDRDIRESLAERI
jgi:hypothetical protein